MKHRMYLIASLVLVSLSLASGTISIKHEVRLLRDREILLVSEAQALEEENQVLQAEWTYLSRPERVERLAEQHLGAAPFAPEQIWTAQDLAARDPRNVLSVAPVTPVATFAPFAPLAPLAPAEVPTSTKQTQQFTIPSFKPLQSITEDTRFATRKGAH